jgi:photosystem II stability/assembly factor-like uncharacterized protein
MKKTLWVFPLLAALLAGAGCSGSGAVSPLSPTNSSKTDSSMAAADSDTIYWTSFPVTFTLTDTLNGVFLLSKKLGWACGNNGVVLQYDGTTWNKVDTGLGLNQNFYAVAFANENEGWVVGSQGTILHYYNGTWIQDNSPTTQNLYGLTVTRSKTVWAVGSNGTLLTYNGISWGTVSAFGGEASAPTTVTNDIYSVGLSSQNNGWAVGNLGLILQYNGQKWQVFPGSPSTEKLTSVSVINDVQAWIVGAFGTILRFNGTTWNKMGSAYSGFDLYQVYMKNDDDGWAVGQDGTLIYYDGSRWISHVKPEGKPALNALAFYNDTGFVVGQNGTILKFQPGGEPAKYDFLFKGEIAKKPSKANPYWTLTYTLLNQNAKTSPFITYVLPIPKGFEPTQPTSFTAVTSSGTPSVPTPRPPTPTVTPTPTPSTPGAPSTPGSAKTTGASSAALTSASKPVTGTWKMRDDELEWEVGTVAASEMKSLTIYLGVNKKEKPEYPVVLKADLKSGEKVLTEASPVTLLKAAPPLPPAHITPPHFTTALKPAAAQPLTTPTVTSTPSAGSTSPTGLKGQGGSPANPTPGP